MKLETERLVLRPFEQHDHAAYAAINADPMVMRYYPALLTRAQSDASILRSQAGLTNLGFHFLCAELKSTGVCIGTIGIAKFSDEIRTAIPSQPEVEIGWRFHKDYWGIGLAPEGAAACLRHAWERLNLSKIVAVTALVNTPSRRVMEKIGMCRSEPDDFDHPLVERGHPLRPHILYRICKPDLF